MKAGKSKKCVSVNGRYEAAEKKLKMTEKVQTELLQIIGLEFFHFFRL